MALFVFCARIKAISFRFGKKITINITMLNTMLASRILFSDISGKTTDLLNPGCR